MLNLIIKLLGALIIWVLVSLIVNFVGTELVTVSSTQIVALGNFLKDSAGLIGFLAGACYFIWGSVPARWNV